MFKISLVLICVATAMAQPAEKTVMSGSATTNFGTLVDFKSVLHPPSASMKGLGAGGIFADPKQNIVHRYMIDENTKSYFGYDVLIGSPDSSGAFLVTFQPLTGMENVNAIEGLTPSALPKFPLPQTMHDREAMELDLMVSPDGTKRLTDVIAIETTETKPPPATLTAMPRDYTLDDGPVTFDLSRYRLLHQGQSSKSAFTGKSGSTLWLSSPGEGRYILSLVQHRGFRKEGTVRNNVLAFEDSGIRYEIRFRSPIAGAGKAWNLYVMRTQATPAGIPGYIQFGTDRMENLLPR